MKSDIEFQTGKMRKDPRTMTDNERQEWSQQCAKNAKEYLFSIDQPLVYRDENGKMVAEYKSGRILNVH